MSLAAPRPVERLQAAISGLAQYVPTTDHYWADGMYCRSLFRLATTLIVGKVHKKEHFYIVACGTVMVTDGDHPAQTITGPHVIVSQPGTKRAVYALTDATCITVHRCEETDMAAIDRDLVEEDPYAMFLPGNEIKALK